MYAKGFEMGVDLNNLAQSGGPFLCLFVPYAPQVILPAWGAAA